MEKGRVRQRRRQRDKAAGQMCFRRVAKAFVEWLKKSTAREHELF
jgi:hypothetical protein